MEDQGSQVPCSYDNKSGYIIFGSDVVTFVEGRTKKNVLEIQKSAITSAKLGADPSTLYITASTGDVTITNISPGDPSLTAFLHSTSRRSVGVIDVKYAQVFSDGSTIADGDISMPFSEISKDLFKNEPDAIMFKVHTDKGDREIKADEWKSIGNGYYRTFTFMRDISSPLYKQKNVKVAEVHYYEKREKETYMTSLSYNPSIPYGTHFEVLVSVKVSEVDQARSHLTVLAKLNWLKTTAVKSIITSYSTKEAKDFWGAIMSALGASNDNKEEPKKEEAPAIDKYMPLIMFIVGIAVTLLLFIAIRLVFTSTVTRKKTRFTGKMKVIVVLGLLIGRFLLPSDK